jgi:intracellular sulfur oxidation DsrE/DsrF family protein
MSKRLFFAWLTACFFSASALAQANQNKTSLPARLVIQVSDAEPAKWNLALNNAKNVQEELGAKNVEIEIVAYGPGIGMLKKDAVTNGRVDEAHLAGIKVLACENTMRNQKLTKADMNTDLGYVPTGVVEIMQRQAQGWAYIRP